MDPTTSTKPRRASIPGGTAIVAAELVVATTRHGEVLVLQRLDAVGGPLLRLGYRRGGTTIRGPVSVTPDELAALAAAVAREPAIAELAGSAHR